MTRVTLDSRSGVSLLQLQQNYYVKTFTGAGSRLKFALGISRYQRELKNLRYFASLGLGTPQLAAFGAQAHWGILEHAALATVEVERAEDLQALVTSGALYREGVAGARQILKELALAAKKMHRDGFHHRDLKPRNILVRQTQGKPELFFFDCPSGHHLPRLLLRRGIIRDLAHLQEGLAGRVRRADLMYMYKQYRGCTVLSESDKTLAREALNYHRQRRMTRRRRRRALQKRSGQRS